MSNPQDPSDPTSDAASDEAASSLAVPEPAAAEGRVAKPEAAPGRGDAASEQEESAENARREALRLKARQVTAKQRISRLLIRLAVGVVILAAIAAIAFWVWKTVVPEVTEPAAEPSNLAGGGFVVDDEDLSAMLGTDQSAEPEETEEPETEESERPERLVMHVYVDYLSPEAGAFERTNAVQLAEWVGEGAISLSYHPVATMTAKSSGTKYSQRAAGAAACVATYAPESFVPYNHELLRAQPEVDTAGRTDEELADLAVAVGVEGTASVRDCIEGGRFSDWARGSTTAAMEGPLPGTEDQGLTGAPMILIGDAVYDGAFDDAGELSQFVLTVASDEYHQTPSPTPTPDE